MGGAATLGGRHVIKDTTTNQRLAAAGGGGSYETRPRWNLWGGLFPVALGGKWDDKNGKERDRALALSGRP